MPTYDIYRSPTGNPERDEGHHLGIVRAGSLVEALHIAGRKVTCRPPAVLWACEGDADETCDVIRLEELPDVGAPSP